MADLGLKNAVFTENISFREETPEKAIFSLKSLKATLLTCFRRFCTVCLKSALLRADAIFDLKCQASGRSWPQKRCFTENISFREETPEKAIFSLKSLKATLLTCFRRFCTVCLKSALLRADAIFDLKCQASGRSWPQKRCFTENISFREETPEKAIFSLKSLKATLLTCFRRFCTVCLKSALLRADAIFDLKCQASGRSWPQKRCFTENISFREETPEKAIFSLKSLKATLLTCFRRFCTVCLKSALLRADAIFDLKCQASGRSWPQKRCFTENISFREETPEKAIFSLKSLKATLLTCFRRFCTVCLKSALLRADAIFDLKCQASGRSWPQKRCFTENISFHEETPEKAIFSLKSLKATLLTCFRRFCTVCLKSALLRADAIFDLKCQASGRSWPQKRCFTENISFREETPEKAIFSLKSLKATLLTCFRRFCTVCLKSALLRADAIFDLKCQASGRSWPQKRCFTENISFREETPEKAIFSLKSLKATLLTCFRRFCTVCLKSALLRADAIFDLKCQASGRSWPQKRCFTENISFREETPEKAIFSLKSLKATLLTCFRRFCTVCLKSALLRADAIFDLKCQASGRSWPQKRCFTENISFREETPEKAIFSLKSLKATLLTCFRRFCTVCLKSALLRADAIFDLKCQASGRSWPQKRCFTENISFREETPEKAIFSLKSLKATLLTCFRRFCTVCLKSALLRADAIFDLKCQASGRSWPQKRCFTENISFREETPEKAIFSLKSLKATLLTCFRRFCTVCLKSALLRVDAIFDLKCQASGRSWPQKRCFTENISFHEETPEKAIFSLKSLKATLLTCFRRFCTVWLKSALLRVDAIFVLKCQASGRSWPQKRCFTENISFHEETPEKAIFSLKSLKATLLTCFRRFCTVWLKSALLRVDAIFDLKCQASGRSWPQKRCFTENISFHEETPEKAIFSLKSLKATLLTCFRRFCTVWLKSALLRVDAIFVLKCQASEPDLGLKNAVLPKISVFTRKDQKKLFSV